MDMRKGPMKYVEGDMVESEEAAAERRKRDIAARKRAITAGTPDQATSDSISEFDEQDLPKKKRKKKTVKKNMGGMMKYKKGGTVRGYGMAKGGRPCKMVKMKGS